LVRLRQCYGVQALPQPAGRSLQEKQGFAGVSAAA
jgi:hypothetical protein